MKHFNSHKPGRNSGYAEKPPRLPAEPATTAPVKPGQASAAQPTTLPGTPAQSGTSPTTSQKGADAKHRAK